MTVHPISIIVGRGAGQVAVRVQPSLPVSLNVGGSGPQGPPGPQGDPGSTQFDAIAATAIGGHRVVAWRSDGQVEYADNLTPADAWASVGVTTGAASAGGTVTVQPSGLLVEPSWSWTPLIPIYVGVNGLLTQTVPTLPAFLRIIAVAVTPTALWVAPQPPVILAS